MKRLSTLAILSLFTLIPLAPAAEAPSGTEQEMQQVLAVAREVQSQQATMAENQVKIDAKLATIAEYLRTARIYAGRGGHKGAN